jgi:CrcB protein
MVSWLNLLSIGAAGAIGSLCRYGVTLAAVAVPGGSTVYGTLIANVLGCGLLGALTALGPTDSEAGQRLMLAIRVGFLGSLTTFSTFAGESADLAGMGRWGASTLYVSANLVLGWSALLLSGSLVRGWIQA